MSLLEDDSVVGCENKVEFELTGFRVYGHSHSMFSNGPTRGIRVHLLSQEEVILQSTETDENGDYTFENIVSGEYYVRAEHSSWILSEPSSIPISVFTLISYDHRSVLEAMKFPPIL